MPPSEPTQHGGEGVALLDAVERSIRKRLDDWMRSASEWYAANNGEEAWRDGLVSYLMRGPGALSQVLPSPNADSTTHPREPSHDPAE